MLNRTYWKSSTSYSSTGLLLPTGKNVYQNTAIIPGEPIDKSISTSWYKTKFSTLSRNNSSQITKHEIKDYNVFSVFSTLSGNTTVRYDYMGTSVASSGSGWDITRYICGIDTAIVNLYIPIYLYSTTKGNTTISAIEFINNFNNYKDYTYAIIGRPIMPNGSLDISLHFIVESENAGGILQISSANSFTSVSSHNWQFPTMCQFNGSGSNTATNRFLYLNETFVNSSNYPYQWILPFVSNEINDGEEFNSYAKFTTSFEKYVVIENYGNTVRGCWSPDVIYELIRHVGIPIRDTSTVTLDTKIYIPLVDENGFHSGNWVLSTDKKAKDSSLYKTKTSDNTINPDVPPTPSESDDIQSVGYGYFSNTTMGTLYALKNKLDLEKITQWLLTQTEKIDVANNVVSLKEIPFSLSTLGITPIDTNLHIGGTPVTYQGDNVVVGEIVAPTLPTLSIVFADFDIPRLSGTFLDYSPYTKYELLVPFAPSPISLPDWCVNKNVKAIFLYDIYTTACQYVIECNGERICSVSGNFGIDRPFSAQNVALKDSARLSAQIGTASSVLGGVMSGATGNVGGIISGAIGGVSALSQMILSGKQNYMYTVGANGDSSTVGLYHAAHLKITRTLSAEDENFVHIYGKPLCKVRKLSSLSGYTKCDNVNTSGLTCSESEKQMIKNLLESGVHI